MKTPQEIKAQELVEKYKVLTLGYYDTIECAKIAILREIDLCSDILQELAAKDARSCSITVRLQIELIEVLECLNKM